MAQYQPTAQHWAAAQYHARARAQIRPNTILFGYDDPIRLDLIKYQMILDRIQPQIGSDTT